MTKGLLISTTELQGDYLDRVTKAIKECSPDAATLCDEYCQFLCDASTQLRLKAIRLRTYPEPIDYNTDNALDSVENLMESSQSLLKQYMELEKLQRSGKMPTNFQLPNRMLDGLVFLSK